MVHLSERFNGKEVYLVGSANQSTMLAQRTQKLIEEIKPDTVLVQTSQEWWNQASLLKYVDSQDEMNKYASDLYESAHGELTDTGFFKSQRKWLTYFRLWAYHFMFTRHFRLGTDFNFMAPGLEMKFACEAAHKVGANLHFMGSELDQDSW